MDIWIPFTPTGDAGKYPDRRVGGGMKIEEAVVILFVVL